MTDGKPESFAFTFGESESLTFTECESEPVTFTDWGRRQAMTGQKQ